METTHVEETTSTISVQDRAKRAAVNGLAIVGFLALVFLGVALAIYGARFVPDTISRLTSAVYLSEDPEEPATPGTNATTTVTIFVPVPATSTPSTPTTVATTTYPTTPTTPATPSTGGPYIVRQPTYYYYNTQPQLYGLSDLTVDILEVGYLRGSSTSTFRRDNEIDSNDTAAFRFMVKNQGTNATGLWRFRIELPTRDNDNDVYTSGWQSSLMPGASKTFTMGFDDPEVGNNRRIEIEVDYNDAVNESSERNNDDSTTIDVKR